MGPEEVASSGAADPGSDIRGFSALAGMLLKTGATVGWVLLTPVLGFLIGAVLAWFVARRSD